MSSGPLADTQKAVLSDIGRQKRENLKSAGGYAALTVAGLATLALLPAAPLFVIAGTVALGSSVYGLVNDVGRHHALNQLQKSAQGDTFANDLKVKAASNGKRHSTTKNLVGLAGVAVVASFAAIVAAPAAAVLFPFAMTGLGVAAIANAWSGGADYAATHIAEFVQQKQKAEGIAPPADNNGTPSPLASIKPIANAFNIQASSTPTLQTPVVKAAIGTPKNAAPKL